MFPRRQLLSTSYRALNQLRSPKLRTHVQHRYESTPSSELHSTKDNSFIRERQAVKEHAAKSADLWRKISLYVVPPSLLIFSINAWNLWNEHWEHWEHMPPLEERKEYPYQNIRLKAYPWGDGDKTLFWNDKVNYHHKD